MSLNKRDAIFLLSWLSNIGSSQTSSSVNTLEKNARAALANAFGNATIQEALKKFWPSNSVPQPSWDLTVYSHQLIALEHVVDNAMYMIEGVDPNDGQTPLYVIGVSGTNPISKYGWFTEDLEVNQAVEWSKTGLPASTCNATSTPDPTKPYIALGTCKGVDILLNKMMIGGKGIAEFLRDKISDKKPKAVEIAVAGHSLGGALAPTLALALQQYFLENQVNGSAVYVSAWPTAGPTPGNGAFATYLTDTLNGYDSVYNINDVVPHGWQISMMNQVASLFCELNITTCSADGNPSAQPGPIKPNALISGLVSYAQSLPVMDYIRSKDTTTFSNPGATFDVQVDGQPLCSFLFDAATGILEDMKGDLNKIQSTCKPGSTATIDDVMNMLIYFIELGYQHVPAYPEYFFQGQGDLIKAVHNAIPSMSKDGMLYGLEAFKTFISKAADYYKNGGQCTLASCGS